MMQWLLHWYGIQTIYGYTVWDQCKIIAIVGVVLVAVRIILYKRSGK